MSNTLKFGNGEWYGKEGTILAYNSENNNYKPLPFTFDRASSATRVNKDGLIETVGADQPRIDYLNNTKGALLLEPSRTNLVPYSEDFNNSAWNKIAANITPNNTISPDGTQNSDLFVPNSSGGQIYDGLGSKAASAISYTTSLYVKPKGLSSLRVYLHGVSNADRGDATFNLSNQTVSFSNNGAFTNTSASILSVGNGWYRCILVTTSDTSTSLQLVIRYDGSTDNVSGLNLWGCQTEQGSYATSYIKSNSGSAVTRLADSCSQTVPDGVIGQTEGTIFTEINIKSTESIGVYSGWKIDGTSGNQIAFITYPNGRIQATVFDSGSLVVNINDNNYGLTSGVHKIAFAYKQNDYILYVDGSIVGNDTSATVPVVKDFDISYLNLGSLKYNETKLYNKRLSNSELQALTQV